MLPNFSNAALFGILRVKCVFTKGDLCNMLGIPMFNVSWWPPCLCRSGYAQAGGKLFQPSCLLDCVSFLQHQGKEGEQGGEL